MQILNLLRQDTLKAYGNQIKPGSIVSFNNSNVDFPWKVYSVRPSTDMLDTSSFINRKITDPIGVILKVTVRFMGIH